MSQVINLDVLISQFANSQVSEFASNTIIEFIDTYDYAIDSTVVFGNIDSSTGLILPLSIDPQSVVSNPSVIQTILLQSIESTIQFGNIDSISFSFNAPSIASELAFGDSRLVLYLQPTSIASTSVVSNIDKLSFIINLSSLDVSTTFGWDDPLLNMEITNVPLPAIESTVVIPQHAVRSVLRPLSINTTVNFGVPTFTDSIHRLLIFKDDNITKVGNTDAVVIAGGIRMNPSIAKTTTAEAGSAVLPSNPVGFISVNIDGNDYKVPYYN